VSTTTTIEVMPATVDDVPAIDLLLQGYSSQGNLLPRTTAELYERLRDFFVIRDGEHAIACVALEIFTPQLGEVRSLAVEPAFARQGYGRLLVQRIIDEASALGLSRLMALTYVPGFFGKLGFRVVDKQQLPEKVWGVCVKCYKFHHCDEIAMLRLLEPAAAAAEPEQP
jgi:amino-acid N-acetyltransferase